MNTEYSIITISDPAQLFKASLAIMNIASMHFMDLSSHMLNGESSTLQVDACQDIWVIHRLSKYIIIPQL